MNSGASIKRKGETMRYQSGAFGVIWWVVILAVLLVICGCDGQWGDDLGSKTSLAAAQVGKTVRLPTLLNAIRRAEGNPNYGLLSQASCVDEPGMCRYLAGEVVRIHLTRCRDGEDAVGCIARQWAPIGVSNDPDGLNVNWERNVRYFLARGENKNGKSG